MAKLLVLVLCAFSATATDQRPVISLNLAAYGWGNEPTDGDSAVILATNHQHVCHRQQEWEVLLNGDSPGFNAGEECTAKACCTLAADHPIYAKACHVWTSYGGDNSTTCPFPEASAFDHHNGDITESVIVKSWEAVRSDPARLPQKVDMPPVTHSATYPDGAINWAVRGEYMMSYDVKDSSGNEAETVQFAMIMRDVVPPTFKGTQSLENALQSVNSTINGKNISAMYGNHYKQYYGLPNLEQCGVGDNICVTDNYDGDLSVSRLSYSLSHSGTVYFSGNGAADVDIDTSLLGEHTLTLVATDWANIFGKKRSDRSHTIGGTTLTDDVRDNNVATWTMTFNVVDATPPSIFCRSSADNEPVCSLQPSGNSDDPPTLSCSYTVPCSEPIEHECNTTYTDPGAICIDSLDSFTVDQSNVPGEGYHGILGTDDLLNEGAVAVSTSHPGFDHNIKQNTTVTYTCFDASGNENDISREVAVNDTSHPMLTVASDTYDNLLMEFNCGENVQAQLSDWTEAITFGEGYEAHESCQDEIPNCVLELYEGNCNGIFLKYDANGNFENTTAEGKLMDCSIDGSDSSKESCFTAFSDQEYFSGAPVKDGSNINVREVVMFGLKYTCTNSNGLAIAKCRTIELQNTDTCNPQPIDCELGTWEAWSTCTKTCGQGTQMRARHVTRQPQFQGSTCDHLNEWRNCNSVSCPKDCEVNAWHTWGSCSQSCDGGVQTRTRVVVQPQFGGKVCPVSKELMACSTQPCAVDCVSDWFDWSACSKSCGTGVQLRHPRITISGKHGGEACPDTETRDCNDHSCPKDCEVGSWGAWDSCDVSCGGSWQTRTRVSTAPESGGKTCPYTQQTQQCNVHPCPQDCEVGAWQAWGECGTSCGGGTQTRTRTNTAPLYGGKACMAHLVTQTCNNHACPVDCQYSSWEDWSTCSESCETGTQFRKRTTTDPTKGGAQCGEDRQYRSCNHAKCPIDCEVGSWGVWDQCTTSCYGGTDASQGWQTRLRVHVLPVYGGKACPTTEQKQVCNTHVCPYDCTAVLQSGSVSAWSVWGVCTQSCGGGTQARSRTGLTEHGGAQCPSDWSAQTQECNTQPCPEDCGVAAWSAWSTCTKSCGAGDQTRTRVTTEPSSGGVACPHSHESQTCNSNECPIDCEVTASYTTGARLAYMPEKCDKVCKQNEGDADGRKWDQKNITKPQFGGAECDGVTPSNTQDVPGSSTLRYLALTERTCDGNDYGSNTPVCAQDCVPVWGAWTPCPKSCGFDASGHAYTQSRSLTVATTYHSVEQRSANGDVTQIGGEQCPAATMTRECNAVPCPSDCEVYHWAGWGTCSQSCGTGSQTRTRIVVEPSYGGSACPTETHTQDCNTHSCPVDATYGTWTSFGDCSQSCGTGSYTRTRTCTPGLDGGVACPATENTAECNTHSCPSDCIPNYNVWEPCTTSCGTAGLQSRTYTLDQPEANGGNCETTVTRECNRHPCPTDCAFTESPWSTCTKSCGSGSQTKSRTITVSPTNGGEACPPLKVARDCNEHACPVDCTITSHTEWGECTSSHQVANSTRYCGTGEQTRAAPATSGPLNGGAPCDANEIATQRSCSLEACPEDCTYSSWGGWSGCSKSCLARDVTSSTIGKQTRSRTINEHAQYGGFCAHHISEEQTCNTFHCPSDCVVGDWQEWGSCSATCGEATQISRRHITPAEFGGSCDVDTTPTKTRACNTYSCDETVLVVVKITSKMVGISKQDFEAPAQPSSVQQCFMEGILTVLGIKNSFDVADVVMQVTETSDVDTELNIVMDISTSDPSQGSMLQATANDPMFSTNVANSGCSSFTALAKTPHFYTFVGVESDETVVKDCVVSTWTVWTDCSATCDRGSRTRTREVTQQRTSSGDAEGRPCPAGIPAGADAPVGNAQTETQACNDHPCSSSCEYAVWGNWGPCQKSCGSNNKRKRFRHVASTDYSYAHAGEEEGGAHTECPDVEQEDDCPASIAPVDCPADCQLQYGPWDTACSADCIDEAHQNDASQWPHKTRTITIQQQPTSGGASCDDILGDVHKVVQTGDTYTEYKNCSAPHFQFPICPVDCVQGSWGAWSDCTKTCGGGAQTRTRVTVPPRHGGAACPPDVQFQNCATIGCPIDCKYEYGVWGPCSKSCGGGQRSRPKTLRVAMQHGGATCDAAPVVETEGIRTADEPATESCNSHACPTDCEVGGWSAWSTCTTQSGSAHSCGAGGTQTRTRTTTVPLAGGKLCPASSDSQSCNAHPCPIDCELYAWAPPELSQVSCSVTCGHGTRNQIRAPSIAAQYGGVECNADDLQRSEPCHDESACGDNDCRVNAWDAWSPCSKTCATGSQTRTRAITTPPTGNGTPCPHTHEYATCNENPCPTPCQEGATWDEGTCSKSCGGGKRTRRRENDVAATYGGAKCSADTQTLDCNVDYCPVDCTEGEWTAYSDCSATCGSSGTKTRKRTNYLANDKGSNAACFLPGSNNLACTTQDTHTHYTAGGDSYTFETCIQVQEESCNRLDCPVDCVIGNWDAWGLCRESETEAEVSCGGGQQIRTRAVTQPTAGGKACGVTTSESQSCNTHECPIDCELENDWSDDTCSVTCGMGTKMQRKHVVVEDKFGGKTCAVVLGEDSDQTANPHFVVQRASNAALADATAAYAVRGPVSCQPSAVCSDLCRSDDIGQWTTWSTCQSTCNLVTGVEENGQKTRSRTLDPDAPTECEDTNAVPLTESVPCNVNKPCGPCTCEYHTWSVWTACSATCGANVVQHRKRDLDLSHRPVQCKPTTTEDIQSCNRPLYQTQWCENIEPCPVDGTWETWSSWGACVNKDGYTVTCGHGTQTRTRSCIGTDNGGADCHGDAEQTKPCQENPCPVDCLMDSWSAWSTCPHSCGINKGNHSRSRTIKRHAAWGGVPCPPLADSTAGKIYQSEPCNSFECPVDCALGAWTPWDTCTRSCGAGGSQTRSREVNRPANHGGETCTDASEETQNCNTHACPGDCVVETWQPWSTCTQTCGTGIQTRTRVTIAPTSGGVGCPHDIHYRSCNTHACPVDCVYGTWDSWTVCKNGADAHSCGTGGTQTRTRSITEPLHGGTACMVDQTSNFFDGGYENEPRACNAHPCPVDCHEAQAWGSWSTCLAAAEVGSEEKSCGGGIAFRTRELVEPQNGGAACGVSKETRTCNSVGCPKDCEIGQWDAWKPCTQSCNNGVNGGGTQLRRRKVLSPWNGGLACPATEMSQSCNTHECPVDCDWSMGWSHWTGCSATCGDGTHQKTRPVVEATYGGVTCHVSGSAILDSTTDVMTHQGASNWLITRTKTCTHGPCPVDCKLEEWSSWSSCSQSCSECAVGWTGISGTCASWDLQETGYQTRHRRVISDQQSKQIRGHGESPANLHWDDSNVKNVLDPNHHAGQDFNGVNCENHTIQNHSQGINQPGQELHGIDWTVNYDTNEDAQNVTVGRYCNAHRCPIDCEVGTWGGWSSCTASCAGGTQERTRTIIQPIAGGKVCPEHRQEQQCNTSPCPLDCNVGTWHSWSSCTQSCHGGAQTRTRELVQPKYGGVKCPSHYESQRCNTHACPIDCDEGPWGTGWQGNTWTNAPVCSRSCSTDGVGGTYKVVRKYQKAPKYGGKACAHSEEERDCNHGPCPVNCEVNAWTSWDECTVSCGSGTQHRDRTVNQAKVDSKTCHTGEQGHTNFHYNEAMHANFHQNGECTGQELTHVPEVCPTLEQKQNCNTQPCPEDCGVAAWSAWSTCTKSCGAGDQTRTRVTTEPSSGGVACPHSYESQTCNSHVCPIDCEMTPWTSWSAANSGSACSKSCGGGSQLRMRSVSVPVESGGLACLHTSESQTCNTHACPEDCELQTWSLWSTCTEECGPDGSQTRTRTAVDPQTPKFGGLACETTQHAEQSCNTAKTCAIDCSYSGSWGSWDTCTCTHVSVSHSPTLTSAPPAHPTWVWNNRPVKRRNGLAAVTLAQLGSAGLALPRFCNETDVEGAAGGNQVSWSGSVTADHESDLAQSRTINAETGNYEGSTWYIDPDTHKPYMLEYCHTSFCPIDSVTGDWGEWDTCTSSCGGGSQTRTRMCTQHAYFGGDTTECQTLSDTQACNTHVCPTPYPTPAPTSSPTNVPYPIINVIGGDMITVEATTNLQESYDDQGATCYDAHDKDRTQHVVVMGDIVNLIDAFSACRHIQYECTNTAGLTSSKIRTVCVEDTECPTCTMNNAAVQTVTVEASFPYVDGGASCEDSFDGAKTMNSNLDVVNVEQTGTYVITYSATDDSGNQCIDDTHKNPRRTVVVVDTLKPVIGLQYGTKFLHSTSSNGQQMETTDHATLGSGLGQDTDPSTNAQQTNPAFAGGMVHQNFFSLMAETATGNPALVIGALVSAISGLALVGYSAQQRSHSAVEDLV